MGRSGEREEEERGRGSGGDPNQGSLPLHLEKVRCPPASWLLGEPHPATS